MQSWYFEVRVAEEERSWMVQNGLSFWTHAQWIYGNLSILVRYFFSTSGHLAWWWSQSKSQGLSKAIRNLLLEYLAKMYSNLAKMIYSTWLSPAQLPCLELHSKFAFHRHMLHFHWGLHQWTWAGFVSALWSGKRYSSCSSSAGRGGLCMDSCYSATSTGVPSSPGMAAALEKKQQHYNGRWMQPSTTPGLISPPQDWSDIYNQGIRVKSQRIIDVPCPPAMYSLFHLAVLEHNSTTHWKTVSSLEPSDS